MTLTKQQRKALKAVFDRTDGGSYLAFRRLVIYGPDYILVPFANMLLGIERDGHTHS